MSPPTKLATDKTASKRRRSKRRRPKRLRRIGAGVRRLLSSVVVRPIVIVSRAVGSWFKRRRFRRLLIGSPALIVAGVLLTAILWQANKPKASIVSRYRTAAYKALRQQDWESADLYLRKLLQIDATDREARYHYALVFQGRGDQESCARIMSELAPDDAVGYPQAHF